MVAGPLARSVLDRHVLALPAGVMPPPLLLRAFVPGAISGEMRALVAGAGAMEDTRPGPIWVPDYQGVYQEFAATELAYAEGRVTGEVGSRVVHADDGAGGALTPWRVHAPQATNSCPYSRDFSNWTSVGGGSYVTDQVGITGEDDTASRLIDDDVTAIIGMKLDITVPTDSNRNTIVVWVKYVDDETSFPSVAFRYLGGTTINRFSNHINRKTGAVATSAPSTVNVASTREGDFWKFAVSLANNGTNPTLTGILYPTAASSFGAGNNVTMTGETTFDHVQVFLNVDVDEALGYPPILTAGAAEPMPASLARAPISGNWSNDEVMAVVRVRPQYPYTAQAVTSSESILSVADAAESALFLRRDAADSGPKSHDGTGSGSIPATPLNHAFDDELILGVVASAAADNVQAGFANKTQAVAWQWQAPRSFDGAFTLGSYLNVLFGHFGAAYMRDLRVYGAYKGTDWIEANFAV